MSGTGDESGAGGHAAGRPEARSNAGTRANSPAGVTLAVDTARRTIGGYLILLVLTLAYVLVALWPNKLDGDEGWEPGFNLFSMTAEISDDSRLLLLVLLTGALGSCVHAATSFASFVGNESLRSSWAWWYMLRPFIGMALAMIFYFAVRGGFLSTGADTGSVSLYGMVAMAGLVGMFSKQATDKLEEVFVTMFRTHAKAGDGSRTGKLDDSVHVDRLMITTDHIGHPPVPEGGLEKLAVSELMDLLSKGYSRIPLLDANRHVQYVVHDSLIYRYIAVRSVEAGRAAEQFDVGKAALGGLLDYDSSRKLASAIAFVSPRATLSDARTAMEKVEHCRDVFVTEQGGKDEPVLGWLTNVDISRATKVG